MSDDLVNRLREGRAADRIEGHLTQDQVVARLRTIVKTRGAQSRLADEIGVSRSFLNEVIKGTRPPTGKILDFLGLQSQTVYLHKGENS